MTPFEIDTDLSSSIRIPAHCCGVMGLKPAENRVPLTGLFPDPRGTPRLIRAMLSIGPMARTVEDLELIYKIIAGPDGQDTEVRPSPTDEALEFDRKTLRIAITPTFSGLPAAADIREAVKDFARNLERAGAVVEDGPLPEVDFSQELSSAGELIGMMVGAFELEGDREPATLARYLAALHRRDQSIMAWERFFEKWDALLCPACMVTAFAHCKPGTPLRVDQTQVDYRMVSAHGALFNYTGHPVVVLPSN